MLTSGGIITRRTMKARFISRTREGSFEDALKPPFLLGERVKKNMDMVTHSSPKTCPRPRTIHPYMPLEFLFPLCDLNEFE